MTTATPSIPPRPSRSAAKQDMPLIPPRPARHLERSMSPNRAEYTRSPLNEMPLSPKGVPSIYQQRNISVSDLEDRPPSVQELPSIGHEGDEYASLERTLSGNEYPRIVSPDLPMHAPVASLSKGAARSQIQTVTRTDSSQAAAAGIGKPHLEDGQESEKSSLRAKASFNRSTSTLPQSSAPASVHEADHIGIPEIGIQVPMYPNAGDVQAPSRTTSTTPHTPGIGFFNDGSQRNHHRRRSSRQDLNPPGSYGMHGHGMEPRDQFEKAWYQRHPDEAAKEARHSYDPGHPRSEWAMSSEQLNNLVHSNVNRGLPASGAPDEQTGYQTVEKYSSRKTSPRPAPLGLAKRTSHGSQTHVESPLRKANFPFNEEENHGAVESEDEEHASKDLSKVPTRGTAANAQSVDLPAEVAAEDYNIPILASDELARYPTNEYQNPAVEYERKADDYASERRSLSRDRQAGDKRSSSRSSVTHGEPLARLRSIDRHEGSGVGTPLHALQEYEPLFPEDDDKPVQKPVNKHLRPDLARHHFPSQDIWEDSPDSLSYTAEVSTPEMPATPVDENGPQQGAKAFETPEVEAQRKNGPLPTDRAHFLPEETKKYADPRFKPGVLRDIPGRPGLQPRFPSQDVWEDTPDSMRLETTVTEPQSTEEAENVSPVDVDSPVRPYVPARPAARTKSISPEDVQTETSPIDKKAPTIPERPKPSVPARPAAKSVEPSAGTEAPAAKAKPAVPSRPAGKIASLKASFMNDLNSRLQLGPQAPKKEEPKEELEEAAPLADARKGRARGPARRKPAAAETTEAPAATSGFSFVPAKTWFHRSESGIVELGSSQSTKSIAPEASTAAEEASALPAEAVGAEGDVPELTISQGTLDERKEIEPVLAQALASEDKSVPPATEATSEQQTQTGEHHITVTSPEGEKEKFTSFVDGNAPHSGDVIVREDGAEKVSEVSEGTQV